MAEMMSTGMPVPGFSLNMNKFWWVTRALHNTLIELAPELTIPGETSRSFEPGNCHIDRPEKGKALDEKSAHGINRLRVLKLSLILG
jgi:hypothetical protein